ncbi:MAG: O-acetylhomoserine aminocarboxypropyltransferase [Nitratiruptor sp.]|nr:O-acetylhomoserine aminocarboxypropyltransferase [Nitratiruptor sp.]NPA84314.1 O-acetylhomoserine aminocarboxypropyltransferase/cysteine synthase [Campylobacterota bacterium]
MHKETLAIHAGYERDGQKSMAVPIYMTTAFAFESAEHAASLFALEREGNIYTRIGNPTTEVLEARFAALEGGVGALATASGMAAITYALLNLCQAGDNIVVANQLYGGSVTLVTHTLKRLGIEGRTFDLHNPEELESKIDEKTRAIFFESITNPSIDVPDFQSLVAIANRHGIITITDNTVATPILCNPLELGVDVVVHSTSKYTTGQGLALGGIIVEGASAKEKLQSQRYPHFNEPDPSYHGLIYTQTPYPPFTLRARLSLLRDMGAAPSPFNSWLFIQGLEHLPLRIRQHSQSALTIAKWLAQHPKVQRVHYPLLPDDPNYPNATKYLKGGASGLLSFEVASFEEAKRIANSVTLFARVVNIGDSKSIITHPASTTHQQLSPEELLAAGVKPGLIRLSIGLEHPQDLIADLEQALSA